MGKIKNINENVPWDYTPGLIELVEQFGNQTKEIKSQNVFLPQKSRGTGQLEKLIKWLQGYRKDRVICDHKKVYVPFIELWSPPGGRAELTYEVSEEDNVKADITVFGVKGFGGASKRTISEAITIDVSDKGRAFLLGFEITVTRYVHSQKTQNYFDRTDVFGAEYFDYKFKNIHEKHNPYFYSGVKEEDLDIRKFVINGIIRSKDSDKSGVDIYSPEIKQAYSWSLSLAVPGVPLLKSPIDIGIETSKTKSFKSNFFCPRGYDYIFFNKRGEMPIVPYCARLLD